jgi:hypothetical protein
MRFLLWCLPSLLAAQTYDIVLQRGRVMDHESGLDGVRKVGVTFVRTDSGELPLQGYGRRHHSARTRKWLSPVSEWYAARESKALINFGASAGHIPARMAVMKDTGNFLPRDAAMNRPATPEELKAITAAVEKGLDVGALGMGLGLAYTLLGRNEEAFARLEKAYDEHDCWLNLLKLDRRLDDCTPTRPSWTCFAA